MKADEGPHVEGVEPGPGEGQVPCRRRAATTLDSATTERSTSMVTSMPNSAFWKLADTSMPT